MPDKFTINYIELPLVDHAKTKEFYESVFGWKFQDWGPEYMCFQEAGIDIGFGKGPTPAASSTGVLVVVQTADLEKAESRIKEFGCEVVTEVFEFPGGRRFHFADPNGNVLAVWTPTES